MSRHEWIAKAVQPTLSSCWEIQFPARQNGHVDNCENTVLNNEYFNKSRTIHVSPSTDTALDVVFDALSRERSISVWISILFCTDAIVCQISTFERFENRFLAITFELLIIGRCPCAHSNQRQIWTLENAHPAVSDSKNETWYGKSCFPGTPS